MTSICFVAPGLLPMLREENRVVYGGSELRAWRFARGLAERGFAVSIAAFDQREVSADQLGSISIVRPRVGHRGWSEWFARADPRQLQHDTLWKAARADIYVAFGVGEYTAALAAWCNRNHRELVLVAGSDMDFSSDYRADNRAHNPYGSRCDLCHEAVVNAGTIIVQTDTQRRLLQERFGRDGRVIANPIALSEVDSEHNLGRHVLWVGKSDAVKRPDVAVEIAGLCPEVSFRMIVNPVDQALFERVRAAAPANMSIAESVPPRDMPNEYRQAFALLNTSRFEGFPNAFLEAGSFRLPILSLTVDPGDVIAREQAGVVAQGDRAALVIALRRFNNDRTAARFAGDRMRAYVERCHDAPKRITEFAVILAELRPKSRSLPWTI